MPIGKNAIKRVVNNGYSNVKTKAPDMENSTVIANPSPEVVEKLLPKTENKKPAASKTSAKAKTASAKKSAASKKQAKPAEKHATENIVAKESALRERVGSGYVNIGEKLPEHLL